MPSQQPLPTIAQLLDAYSAGAAGLRRPNVEVIRGDKREWPGGSAAILWARQAQRDRDLFRGNYRDTARAAALDQIVERRYGVERRRESKGVGTATLTRPTPGAGGTIYAGTRIELLRLPRPAEYAVSADTSVAAADLVVQLPIQAVQAGTGTAAHTAANLRLADIVFDEAFTPLYVDCNEGQDEERDADYIARAKREQPSPPGYLAAIDGACREQGAANVLILLSDTFGEDLDGGVSHVYVADAGFGSPDSLVRSCFRALDSARVAGCDMRVSGMQITQVSLQVTLTLWKSKAQSPSLEIRRRAAIAAREEFDNRMDFWVFRLSALQGAIAGSHPDIREALVAATPAEPQADFPATLPKYVLSSVTIL